VSGVSCPQPVELGAAKTAAVGGGDPAGNQVGGRGGGSGEWLNHIDGMTSGLHQNQFHDERNKKATVAKPQTP